MRRALLAAFKEANVAGRAKARELLAADGAGIKCAERISWLQDQLITLLHDFVLNQVFDAAKAPEASRIAVTAVGGYGRGTLAPGSDIDLLFLLPAKKAVWAEPAIEFMLYILWDLGFKVGHATRTIEECIRLSRADMTIRTAILECRYVCGSAALANELETRFDHEIVRNTGPEFIAAKLAERDERHRKAGDTRYLVEPNVKEGKGGLRDLHTLFWISNISTGSRTCRSRQARRAFEAGIQALPEGRGFSLGGALPHAFPDRQGGGAPLIRHPARDRRGARLSRPPRALGGGTLHEALLPGGQGRRRPDPHLLLGAGGPAAKDTPGITGVISRFRNRVRKIAGTLDFVDDGGRIALAGTDVFKRDPVNLMRLFHIADINGLEFHPAALKQVTRSLGLITPHLRENEEANRLFLSILTSRRNPELILRRMNEAGVLGRFIPEFGKIVSMMQFNMYHHYTVDEHLLRSVDVLSRIERGLEEEAHPLTAMLMPGIEDREALYVAVLLHDIAKGRPEDHSVAGAKVARKLCPRFRLTPKQTEMVVWLVEEHLTMSMVAQTRDLTTARPSSIRRTGPIPRTAEDAAHPHRLRHPRRRARRLERLEGPAPAHALLRDRASALGRFFGTVAQGAGEARRPHAGGGARRLAQEGAPGLCAAALPALSPTVALEEQVRHAGFIREADRAGRTLATMVRTHDFHAITEITVLSPDHPRLLTVIAGACAAAGANIVGAQIHTTSDGRALDTILVNREFSVAEDETRRAASIGKLIEDVLSGRKRLPEVIASRTRVKKRSRAFTVTPEVTISNTLSNKFTVIEVEGLDRTGLLSEVTAVLSDLSLDIASAHITTFGEKVIDTFYVTDLVGSKITSENRQMNIAARLKAVLAGEVDEARERMPSGIIAPTPVSVYPTVPNDKSRNMSLVKKFATVGGATLGSRLFGFIRETFMAAALGTGPVADAFNTAFRLPNTFRRLFAEGAFNSAFVPLFAKEIEAHGMDGARRFSEEVLASSSPFFFC